MKYFSKIILNNTMLIISQLYVFAIIGYTMKTLLNSELSKGRFPLRHPIELSNYKYVSIYF